MPIKPRQVIEDFRQKLRLEGELRADWKALGDDMAKAFTRQLGQSRTILDVEMIYLDRTRAMLDKHYSSVADVFDGQMGKLLPEGLKPRLAELATIDDALTVGFGERSAIQSVRILETTAENAAQALEAARAETQRFAAEGVARSHLDEAVDAGRTFDLRLRGRASGIASLETQAPAEIAKLTETEILTGHTPTISGGTYSEPDLIKRWWTQGDDLVREDHLEADQQEQPVNQPFIVGGASLMAPGDTSLGAPLAQVVNCRCSAEFDEEAVANIRRERGLANA